MPLKLGPTSPPLLLLQGPQDTLTLAQLQALQALEQQQEEEEDAEEVEVGDTFLVRRVGGWGGGWSSGLQCNVVYSVVHYHSTLHVLQHVTRACAAAWLGLILCGALLHGSGSSPAYTAPHFALSYLIAADAICLCRSTSQQSWTMGTPTR